jgi:hypothetical protein
MDGLANAADSRKHPGRSITVELDFSPPDSGELDSYHLPMNLAPVGVIRFFVSLAMSEAKRARVIHQSRCRALAARRPD